jgi:c-di-GMP-binding flagellar brake protein YcgR
MRFIISKLFDIPAQKDKHNNEIPGRDDMLQEILAIGDKIDVSKMDHSGKLSGGSKTYVSQLVDFVDSDVINIAAPIGNSRLIILEVGESYSLCFYSNKGLYQCNCVVINNYRENNMIIAVVRLISDLEKFQRRQYFRLECVLDMEYRIITKEEEILENRLRQDNFGNKEERSECRKRLNLLNNEWIKANFTDLSGGGARFNSGFQHQQGEKVRIKFDFILGKNLKNMDLGAEIIASGKLMHRNGVYEHRVEFKNIGKNDREDLIKYIFEQERKRRRNEKN